LIGEIQNKDGTMARLPECYVLAKKHGLCITTVESLAQYRTQKAGITTTAPGIEVSSEPNKAEIELLAECQMPISRADKYLGEWTVRCYRSADGLDRHAVLIKGSPDQWKDSTTNSPPVYTRIHSECFTSHVLGSRRCDCSQQLDVSLEMINKHGSGVAIYVDGHEGRGIGLHNKIKAYHLQQSQSMDTYQANKELGFPIDSRTYETPRAILKHLGISKIALLTNNPLKVNALRDMTATMIPVLCEPNEHNSAYLHAKRIYEKEQSKEVSMPSPIMPSPGVQKEIPLELPSLNTISKLRIGIIRTNWNDTLVSSLESQCKQALLAAGILQDNIIADVWNVPGAFEIPFAAQRLAATGTVDAIICFGVLIKGETMHFEYISSAVATGLMQVQLSSNLPVLYGVLSCLTLEQAQERCGPTSPLPLSLASTALRMAAFNVETKKTIPDLAAVRSSLSVPLLPPCTQG